MNKEKIKVKTETIGTVSVDSGQIIIADPSYLNDEHKKMTDRELQEALLYKKDNGDIAVKDYSFLDLYQNGGSSAFVVDSSGDSLFRIEIETVDMTAINRGKRVVSAKIVFLEDDMLSALGVETRGDINDNTTGD
tara:strand:- start:100 stop:504 length:405 start_codon:yes stop_codon:yes gene_type:complete